MTSSFKNWEVNQQDKNILNNEFNDEKNTKQRKSDMSFAHVGNANSEMLL